MGIAKAFKPLLNVGLRIGRTTDEIEPDKVIKAIENRGYRVEKATLADDARYYGEDGEPTLVVKLDRPLTPEHGEALALDLGQEAIPMKTGRKKNEGTMFGPKADEWGPYNEDYFTTETKYKNRFKPKKDDLEPLEWAGERYPTTEQAARTYEYDKKTGKGKWFDSKVLSPEEWQVRKRRDAAQKDIKAGRTSLRGCTSSRIRPQSSRRTRRPRRSGRRSPTTRKPCRNCARLT